MWQYIRAGMLGLALLVLAACGSLAAQSTLSADPQQPYAGLQNRAIRALSEQKVADLLAGRGAGYALAAELNHYPGPNHVLEMASELRLSPDQEQDIRAIQAPMQQEAQRLGQQLVDLEAKLDQAFRSNQISDATLAQLIDEIGAVESKIRYTHLVAHLQVQALLSPDQIARYDELRGYSNSDGAIPQDHGASGGNQHSGGHGGN